MQSGKLYGAKSDFQKLSRCASCGQQLQAWRPSSACWNTSASRPEVPEALPYRCRCPTDGDRRSISLFRRGDFRAPPIASGAWRSSRTRLPMHSFVSYRQSVFLSTRFCYYSLLQFGGKRGGAKKEGPLLERSDQSGGVKITIASIIEDEKAGYIERLELSIKR